MQGTRHTIFIARWTFGVEIVELPLIPQQPENRSMKSSFTINIGMYV